MAHRISFDVDDDLLAWIDAARGRVSRSVFVRTIMQRAMSGETPEQVAPDEPVLLALAAIIHGAGPEDVERYVDEGFPSEIAAILSQPGEREELRAHLNVLRRLLADG